ncbi:MAG: patatin-like phospholipase family protein [Nitrososphaeraceae archaeon]
MSREKATISKKEQKEGIMQTPSKQRALIFQGGGALGAYEAGVYRVLHDWIYKNLTAAKRNENLFDVIAGTSIGAINGAILVSYVLRNKREEEKKSQASATVESQSLAHYWYGSADALEDFWNKLPMNNFLMSCYDLNFWPWDYFHATTKTVKESWTDMLDRAEHSAQNVWKNNTNPFVNEWFDLLRFCTEAWDIPASTEAARRHYSTKTFASPNVAAAIPRFDLKFWDNPHGFRFRGEQRRIPFTWRYPNYSLREACRGNILDSIKTDFDWEEPRLLFVTADVQSGDTISFDSYDTQTMYDEYDENAEQTKEDKNKRDNHYKHLIRYPNGIEWEQLSTTFSMPDLYSYATLEDESLSHETREKKRTYWDGGVSSNTPLRELISQHKKYWSEYIGNDKLWDGEKGVKIPALDVYISDVWPAKIADYPVPSDNDFVISRKSNLLLMDKTEYEESVTKMITQYMKLVERLLGRLNDKDKAATKEVLDEPVIDHSINRKGIKIYRDLLKGNFDIDRVMRIERKDDTFAVGLAMADFSAHTIRQLMTFGKYDALDKLINTLSFTLQNLKDQGLKKVPTKTKDTLHYHLKEASIALGSKANDHYSYDQVMKHLNNFVDEVNMMETKFGNDIEHEVIDLLRP